jgi:hypothetical protein
MAGVSPRPCFGVRARRLNTARRHAGPRDGLKQGPAATPASKPLFYQSSMPLSKPPQGSSWRGATTDGNLCKYRIVRQLTMLYLKSHTEYHHEIEVTQV